MQFWTKIKRSRILHCVPFVFGTGEKWNGDDYYNMKSNI